MMMNPIVTSVRISIRPLQTAFVPFQHGEYLRAIVYETMKPLWNNLHDTNSPKPFSINPLQFPPGMKRERKTFVVPPHVHGYFDVVVFGNEMTVAVKKLSSLKRKTVKIGDSRFKVVSTSIKFLTEETLEADGNQYSKLKVSFKTPLFFIENGYGKEFRIHELPLERILRTPFRIYNMISKNSLNEDLLSQECKNVRLVDKQSSLKPLRFPVHNDDKQIIYTGHKGNLVFKGEINGTISKLVRLANWVNVGHGRTIGLGKIHARMY
ncbi:MAG: CRISPR system precrRNA processing endoribonuclease RAMP protein Cas6 [Methanobacteriota archaeon]|nr:MAG: CRISPR system precrRNA processing endoribonuclease RAMP protein Cas6 [Euryarchaeota archaeon]